MKFLVIRKPRVNARIGPTSKLIREQKEALLAAVKRGEVDCTYAFVGGGGCSIVNANSTEELNQRLMGSPLGLLMEWDVRPLTDYGQHMDAIAQAFEKQEKQSH